MRLQVLAANFVMPSLEIICINQAEPSNFSYLPFKVVAEKQLISHRGSSSLFQADFDQLEGCIYHLLDEKRVTAYWLLVRDWYYKGNSNGRDYNVEFIDEVSLPVKDMLQQLLLASPVGQILFTTDYQSGPETVERHGPLPFAEFCQLHNEGAIRMNASYLITADGAV